MMSDFLIAFFVIVGWINGIFVGYIVWAPLSPFKQSIMYFLSLRFLWDNR